MGNVKYSTHRIYCELSSGLDALKHGHFDNVPNRTQHPTHVVSFELFSPSIYVFLHPLLCINATEIKGDTHDDLTFYIFCCAFLNLMYRGVLHG